MYHGGVQLSSVTTALKASLVEHRAPRRRALINYYALCFMSKSLRQEHEADDDSSESAPDCDGVVLLII